MRRAGANGTLDGGARAQQSVKRGPGMASPRLRRGRARLNLLPGALGWPETAWRAILIRRVSTGPAAYSEAPHRYPGV